LAAVLTLWQFNIAMKNIEKSAIWQTVRCPEGTKYAKNYMFVSVSWGDKDVL